MAFDTIYLRILFGKINNAEIRGNDVELLASYLHGQKVHGGINCTIPGLGSSIDDVRDPWEGGQY